MNKQAASDQNFGFVISGIGLLLLVASIIVFVAPLPDKWDTLLVIAWLFVPAVVGGLIYARMEHHHSFDEHRRLE